MLEQAGVARERVENRRPRRRLVTRRVGADSHGELQRLNDPVVCGHEAGRYEATPRVFYAVRLRRLHQAALRHPVGDSGFQQPRLRVCNGQETGEDMHTNVMTDAVPSW